jgi:lipopolysaccharide/colanic/teichoic acid biosynthesis glycosyltransferase
MLNTVLRDFWGCGDAETRGLVDRIVSSADFRRTLRLELARAARNGSNACLLQAELAAEGRRFGSARRLKKLLRRHTRLTDVQGRLGRREFGVLLVDTAEDKARYVLNRLEELAQGEGLRVRLELSPFAPDLFHPQPPPEDGPRPDNDRTREVISGGAASGRLGWTGADVSGASLLAAVDSQSLRDTRAALRLADAATRVPGRSVRERPELWDERQWQFAAKRVVDVVGASAGLALTWPVIAVAMAAVKLTSQGPAIYRQQREGKGGEVFEIYKLRTMYQGAELAQAELRDQSERDGPAFKLKNDPRVTPVGRILRKTCIDELPQLINVLQGHMSLVGPRPLLVGESHACESWQRRRLQVRPGLTCDWQVNKHRVETFDQWMRLDLNYADRATLWDDLLLMARTVTVPMTGRGSD